jgi:hypothetical protein
MTNLERTDNCLICLGDCKTFIRYKCECHMICHPNCFEEWISHRKVCMICKKGEETQNLFPIRFVTFFMNITELLLDNIEGIEPLHLRIFLIFGFSCFFSMIILLPSFVFFVISKNIIKNIDKLCIGRFKEHKNYKIFSL